ncbi:GntR family transcriptional regulator [Bombilactobacillus bombi]|uniref:GntR family transcriptional regulator n=1 Tax=Bombilactobacillus bombi TaxID=1303590 RepID=UPI0015E5C5B4|nr:GntR family transcriptional regulator [Bombilactobacillus bombi]MBA1434102.1 GntR family transcriptional regulator [Bombilactobacillus bombi]
MLNSSMNLNLQAYTIILKKIINTTYKPGQKISERDLINELNIGRTPVREAILHLRQEGLIEAVPQSGTYITKIDLQVAASARFVRESIETRVIKEAAASNNPLAINTLNTIVANQKFFTQQRQFEKFFAEDEAFHREFYQMTNRQQVWDWLQTINMQLNRFRMLRLKVEELPWEGLIKEHMQILNAVKNHEPEEARRLIANHLHLMLDEEDDLLKAFPDYFTNIPTDKRRSE